MTSRQDGGAHTWHVDATAVDGGMIWSVVRRSYLRLRARPSATRALGQRRPGSGLRAHSHEEVNAQCQPRPGLRSFGPDSPSRGGKHAVSVEARSAATQFWPCCFALHEAVNAQYRPACCAVSAVIHRHEKVNAQFR
jgi:hypothetical protein